MKKKCNAIAKLIYKYVVITIFSFGYAVGISLFLDPNNLAPGGVTGISIILNRLTGLGTGTWVLILNIPILILGLWKFGVRFMVSTTYCTILSSAFMTVISVYPPITQDKMLAALSGAAIVATSMGMIMKVGATTGGIDIVVKTLKRKYPYMKTGKFYLIIDACVVIVSAILFRDIEIALYATIAIITSSFMMDLVLYGRDGAKMIYIISDKADAIAERLLREVGIGVTFVNGQGGFSGVDKKVIICVMRKPLSPKAQEIVKEEDAESFMIVTDATEIFGEGYKSYFSERL